MRLKTHLPIEEELDQIIRLLRNGTSLILTAEPGAGKSTVVPLALLEAGIPGSGSIVLLEPRRIAARAAANRMAQSLGESVGKTVGYRTRFETAVSKDTRIVVVTEAILTRMIQSDPELKGVGMVIFDEFHERSLHADLGLALTLDLRDAFRNDLKLVVMSATLDAAQVSDLLDRAPVVHSSGRCFPVRTVYDGFLSTPQNLDERMAKAIVSALQAFPGDLLAFLPGEAEIRRTMTRLHHSNIPLDIQVLPLFGSLPAAEQDRALNPDPGGGRRAILATSIAESSITVKGVRIVVDGGFMRVPRFSPQNGMNTLVTLPVSAASAEQRRGRAGRTEDGVCIRLWSRTEQDRLTPFSAPEILETDFTPVLLELVRWGLDENSAASLKWLDFPPAARIRQSAALLRELGAMTDHSKLTPHGEELLQFPLHPRLGHMVLEAARYGLQKEGANLAAILSERDFLRSSQTADLQRRLAVMDGHDQTESSGRSLCAGMIRAAKQIRNLIPSKRVETPREELIPLLPAFAYPDRIAHRIDTHSEHYLLANGATLSLKRDDPLCQEEFLAVAEIGGDFSDPRILLASPVTRELLETGLPDLIAERKIADWDQEHRCVRFARVCSIGAVCLSREPRTKTEFPQETIHAVLLSGIRKYGFSALGFSSAEEMFLQRIRFLHHLMPDSYPECSEAALLASMEQWLLPFLNEVTSLDGLKKIPMRMALESMLTREALRDLNRLAPERIPVPSGSMIRVNYSDPLQPAMAVRLQELFGMSETPRVGGGRIAVMMDLLSPAMRTVQKTSDLNGFWHGSYFLVRKEMRGRYPKHDWPEDPGSALPHRGVRPPKNP